MPLVGESGTGTFTQSGGTNQANVLVLAASAGSWGAYFLEGGLLRLSTLSTGNGAASFNFNGGTLQAGERACHEPADDIGHKRRRGHL